MTSENRLVLLNTTEFNNTSDIKIIDLNNYPCPDYFNTLVASRKQFSSFMQEVISLHTNGATDENEAATRRYEVEYANGKELDNLSRKYGLEDKNVTAILDGECNYTYWTPLMHPEAFQQLLGIAPDSLHKVNGIIDVGAGSGNLIKTFIDWGVSPENITGVDLSPTSALRIQELGCQGYSGRFDDMPKQQQYGLVFLSYFIDRDSDQKSTFTKALQSVEPNGMIVLEGLFPCNPVDRYGMQYANPNTTITKGDSAEEDIFLLWNESKKIASELHMQLTISAVGSGQRNVYSRDGDETLPTDVVVFKRIS